MNLKLLMTLMLILNINLEEVPVLYNEINGTIDGKPLRVHTVIVDMNNEEVSVENVLSKDVIFGLEKVSDMAKGNEAIVAVNGVFYDNYGHHIGGMMKDGQWLTLPSEELPTVMITKENKVLMDEVKFKLWIESDGKKKKLIDGMNRYAFHNKEILLYNGRYGSTTRIYKPVINYLIQDNKVKEVINSFEPLKIPTDYQIIVDMSGENQLDLNVGDQIQFHIDGRDMSELKEVFQTSSWLIRKGEIVAKTKDPVIGYTINREPRTAIGVSLDNKLVIVVVEGRLPGVSVGLSGSELALLMEKLKCTDAVYLDGGASSTLVIKDELVNQPSNIKERLVGHSLIIKRQSTK